MAIVAPYPSAVTTTAWPASPARSRAAGLPGAGAAVPAVTAVVVSAVTAVGVEVGAAVVVGAADVVVDGRNGDRGRRPGPRRSGRSGRAAGGQRQPEEHSEHPSAANGGHVATVGSRAPPPSLARPVVAGPAPRDRGRGRRLLRRQAEGDLDDGGHRPPAVHHDRGWTDHLLVPAHLHHRGSPSGAASTTPANTTGDNPSDSDPPAAGDDPPATVRPVSAPGFSGNVTTVTAADLGSSWRPGCPVDPDGLRLVTASYWGFDGAAPHRLHRGGRVRHRRRSSVVFRSLYDQRFPIRRMEPVYAFGGDDDASMAADNTSGFNCRPAVAEGPPHWSNHAYGLAIDVNPVENPYLLGGQVLPPAGADYLDRSDVPAGDGRGRWRPPGRLRRSRMGMGRRVVQPRLPALLRRRRLSYIHPPTGVTRKEP